LQHTLLTVVYTYWHSLVLAVLSLLLLVTWVWKILVKVDWRGSLLRHRSLRDGSYNHVTCIHAPTISSVVVQFWLLFSSACNNAWPVIAGMGIRCNPYIYHHCCKAGYRLEKVEGSSTGCHYIYIGPVSSHIVVCIYISNNHPPPVSASAIIIIMVLK
jgi:hypothetical protein